MNSQEMEWILKEKYGGEKSEAFFADCRRLALGEPLAYIIGFSPFLDCKIRLDGRPLIPRPETEFWTKEAIKTVKDGTTLSLGLDIHSPKVLDLCAGSGCIGVAVAKEIREARVDFSEIDRNLIPTIKKNLQENGIGEKRINIFHTNLFDNISGTYDFILSNPPYINETRNRTEESVKKHEPYIALFGGKDGMEIIEKIITQAPHHLTNAGQLWIEHEPEQAKLIKELGQPNNLSVVTHKDQYGIERYSILMKNQ